MAIELVAVPQEHAAKLSQHVAPGITRVPGLYVIETKHGRRYYRGVEFWRALALYLMRQAGFRLMRSEKQVRECEANSILTAVNGAGEQIVVNGFGYAPDNSYQSFKSAEARDRVAWAQTRADRVAWRDMLTALLTWQDEGEYVEDDEAAELHESEIMGEALADATSVEIQAVSEISGVAPSASDATVKANAVEAPSGRVRAVIKTARFFDLVKWAIEQGYIADEKSAAHRILSVASNNGYAELSDANLEEVRAAVKNHYEAGQNGAREHSEPAVAQKFAA